MTARPVLSTGAYTDRVFVDVRVEPTPRRVGGSGYGIREVAMRIVEKKVAAGGRPAFDLSEFLSRPLFAHLAHASAHGPRESPVWFRWDGEAVWVVGGESFPVNLRRDARCALGFVDFDLATGRCHHVGMRGTAEVLPFDPAVARTIFRRYFGPDEADWDPRFGGVFDGPAGLELVRFTPNTVVVRDQSYRPTRWAAEQFSGGAPTGRPPSGGTPPGS
jgi:hypothetical protein